MLGKLLFIKMLMAVGFVVMLMHVLFFVVTLALHVLFLAPRLRKIVMNRHSSRHACC
jgi:Zn-dependent membrane protease YugP